MAEEMIELDALCSIFNNIKDGNDGNFADRRLETHVWRAGM
jgi:hypothetical protein